MQIESKAESAIAAASRTSRRPCPEVAGLVLLALALLFNAFLLAPEARIERVPMNDLSFHVGASQVLGEGIAHGAPFMEPWASQWSLGFPLWRVYQPLPHLLGAAVIGLLRPWASPAASFAGFYYLLLVVLPLSVYLGARLMGLNPIAAGIASILILAPSEAGDFSRYGLSYGAYVWRGSGLFTELVALEVMLPALGLIARAIDSGKGQGTAAIGLALTALSHIFFGYIAFVSTAVWALAAQRGSRAQCLTRAVSIAAKAMLLLAWFIIPMMLVSGEVNRSRWDAAYKFDSYGAPVILSELFSGRLLDFGRLPVLSMMTALGALLATFKIHDPLPRRLLVLTVVWLSLYFGRETWGHLMLLVGIPSQFHLHRLESAFELFAVILAAWGLERVVAAALNAPPYIPISLGAVLGAAFLLIAQERAEYLRFNKMWGEVTLTAFESERGDLEAALNDVRAILAERPGRVSAGKAEDWGQRFRVGEAHVWDFLNVNAIDQASYLSHTIPLSSDYMVMRSENDRAQEDFFAIRTVLAPVTQTLPSYFKKRSVHGRFVVYEASPEGYFSLVDIAANYDAPHSTWFDLVTRWLNSWMLRGGELIALGTKVAGSPELGPWQALPKPSIKFMTPRGSILAESRIDGAYHATLDVTRPCYAFIKITYFPGLIARVDGDRAPLIRVAPDFGAIPLTPGHHEVEVRYQPGPLKPLLFVVGIMMFVLVERRPSFAAVWRRSEEWLRIRFEDANAWLSSDRGKVALALGIMILLFTRGLFRGQLIDGHDSTCYPPRLTEFARVIADHHFPAVWAPDLSNGHGQPLFEFQPPLIYFAALPFFECGMSLANSFQLALALLFAIGALGIYLIGRNLSFSRVASLAAAAFWLFAPYQALDVYVSARFAESSALAVTPLALLALIKVLQRPTVSRVALASFAIALVPLAHNSIALMIFPVFVAIVLARAAVAERRLLTAIAGATAIAGGLGLTAFFWAPALVEKNYVKLDLLLQGLMNWRVHIISPIQLLWGRWGFGYSVAGPHDGISFALGPVHIALAIAGILIGVRASNRTRRFDAIVFAAAAAAGALMATEWSAPVWARILTLQYFQFPWRMLFLPALFIPLLALYAFERIGAKATIAVVSLMVLLNLTHTQPKGYRTYDDEYYYPASIAQKGLNTTTREENEPRWVHTRFWPTGTTLIAPESISARNLSSTSVRHSYVVDASATIAAIDPTSYYPGWTALIDGRETPITPTTEYGLISFSVPLGHHSVVVELRPTRVRSMSLIVSLITFAIILLAIGAELLRVRRSKHAPHDEPTEEEKRATATAG